MTASSKFALGHQRIAQADMEGRRAAFQGDRPANGLDGQVELTCLGSDHTEEVGGVGMVRVDGENPAIDLLRGLQPARSMVLDGNRKCFGDRWHGADSNDTQPVAAQQR